MEIGTKGTGVEEDRSLEGILDSPRYSLSRVLGKGTWGTVYEARDGATGSSVAIKVLTPTPLAQKQMAERELAPFEIAKKEGEVAACAHVVPRTFEIDNSGKPFVVMPRYEVFFDKVLRQAPYENRRWHDRLPSGLSIGQAEGYLVDLASGIKEMHRVRGRVHSDLKPDNIAVDSSGKLLISDLGTSTCVSLGWAESRRDNMGFQYTRAPECFSKDSHPVAQSDVWAFGALAYKMFTGKYPLEEELSSVEDPENFFKQLGKEGFDNLMRQKLKDKIPREHKRFSKLMGKCLSSDPSRRPIDGGALKEELTKTMDKYGLFREVVESVKNVGSWTASAAVLGGLIYGGFLNHGIKDPSPPSQVKGLLYLSDSNKGQGLFFDAEQLNDLPEPRHMGQDLAWSEKSAKAVTKDRDVAFLLSRYWVTRLSGGYSVKAIPDHFIPASLYSGYANPGVIDWEERRNLSNDRLFYHKILSEVIGKAVDQVKESSGRVDLEDVCAATVAGKDALDYAKKVSGSGNFRDYIRAKHADGRLVIEEPKQVFIKAWLANIHDTK